MAGSRRGQTPSFLFPAPPRRPLAGPPRPPAGPQAPQRPPSRSRAPHRLHRKRRPLASFTLGSSLAMGGGPAPRPVPRATSAYVRRRPARAEGGELTLPARPAGNRPPRGLSDLRGPADGEGDGTESLVFKMFFFFICRLKTNLEEAKSKTCPLPLAT